MQGIPLSDFQQAWIEKNKFVDDKNPFGVENKGTKSKLNSKQQHVILRKIKIKIDEDVNQKLSPLVLPINAEAIRGHIPKKGEFTFFLMNGNCQFADFILEMRKEVGQLQEAIFTTLSCNEYTFSVLDQLECKKHLLVSSYFLATDTANTLPKLKAEGRLENYSIGFFRNHTKICLLKTETDYFVMCGSANLRSSATIEQFTIINDKNIYDFNRDWILTLIEKYNFEKEYKEYSNTGPAKFDQLWQDTKNQ